MSDTAKVPGLADSPATPEELRQALTEADSLLSLIGYRMAERIGLDLAEETKAASARCRALAERVAFHGVKQARPSGQKITHGRHCTCSACAREDWTNPDLASCGMHGSDCPALYQPWGPAGSYFEPPKSPGHGAA